MTTKSSEPRETFVLKGGTTRIPWPVEIKVRKLSKAVEIRCSLVDATRDSLWISCEPRLTKTLLKSWDWPSRFSFGTVLLLHPPDIKSLPLLKQCFRTVTYNADDGFLELDELVEVLSAKNRADLFIGGTVNDDTKTITLHRGDFSAITVPFSAFKPSGTGTKPDFKNFSIIDYGHTIKLGDYEAAADAVLYEFDPKYRKEQKKKRHASEKSFGASLRRLRKQRKLNREDFEPLAAKTIARIEQGTTKQVQQKTLKTIADRLGVKPEEIEDY